MLILGNEGLGKVGSLVLPNDVSRCVVPVLSKMGSNISNPTMRTGLDFKSAQFDRLRGEAED
jgi:hypothetical protein